MAHRSRLHFAVAALYIAVAAGCGGGGGGSGAPAAPPAGPPAPAGPPPISQVLQWGVFPSAAVVIGQGQDFTRGEPPPAGSQEGLAFPRGNPAVTADGRRLFVAHNAGLKSSRPAKT